MYKRSSRRRWLIGAVCAVAFSPAVGRGQTLYWDGNGLFGGTGGTGTWNTLSTTWAPTSAGILFQVTPPFSNGLVWPNNLATTAAFTGTAGLVTVDGTVSAAGVVVSTSGYQFQGGAIALPGSGASIALTGSTTTATFTGALTVPQAFNGVTVTGGGLAVFNGTDQTTASLAITDATVRVGSQNALRTADVVLNSGGRLDLGNLPAVTLTSMFQAPGAPTFSLGSTELSLLNTAPFLSGFNEAVTGSATGGFVVLPGTSALYLNTTNVGFVNAYGATVQFYAGNSTLTATGSTGFGGRSSLFADTGAWIQVISGTTVTATATPSVHNNGRISVTGTNSLLRVVAGGGVAPSLRIGFAGAGSLLEVGSGGSVISDDLIQLGSTFAGNPGVGTASVFSGGTVTAQQISFSNGASLLDVASGGTVNTGYFAWPVFSGTIRIAEGGVVNITSPFTTGITGTLTQPANDRGGLVTLANGTWVVSSSQPFKGTVAATTLRSLRPVGDGLPVAGVRYDVTGAVDLISVAPGGTLRLGGLLGGAGTTFDLGDRRLELGGAQTYTYSGRLMTTGSVIANGAGTQTFTGGPSAALPTTAGLFSVVGRALRLTGGFFRATSADATAPGETPYSVSTSGVLTIDGGATALSAGYVDVRSGGKLVVSGAGTSLTSDTSNENRALLLVGRSGDGTVLVKDNAAVTAVFVLNGRGGISSTPVVRLETGGTLTTRNLQFEGPTATLVVDGGVLTTEYLFLPPGNSAAFTGSAALSDRNASTPALVLGQSLTVPTLTVDTTTGVRLLDGPSGPGSIRYVATGNTNFDAPVTLTGSLYIDAGTVTPSVPDRFATMTVYNNAPNGLRTSTLPTASTLRVGGLGGTADLAMSLQNLTFGTNARSVTYSGTLNAPNTDLVKEGPGTQTFSGGTVANPWRAQSLAFNSGALRLTGGVFSIDSQSILRQTFVSIGGAAASLVIDGGARVTGTNGVFAAFEPVNVKIDGAGTQLTLASPYLAFFNGPSSLVVSNGAALTTGSLFLSYATSTASTMTVSGGSTVTASGSVVGARSDDTLFVDRASLRTSGINFAGRVSLTDPVGGSALTIIGEGPTVLFTSTPARFEDGPNGPGGVRSISLYTRPTFTGDQAFTGPAIVEQGSGMTWTGQLATRSIIANTNGIMYLLDPTFDGTGKTFRTDSTGVISYGLFGVPIAVSGGLLRGPGHRLTDGSSLTGVTLFPNAALDMRNGSVLSSAIVSGAVNPVGGAGVTLDGVIFSTGSTFNSGVGSRITAVDIETSGALNIQGNATFTYTGALSAGAGAQVTVSPGARLVSADPFELSAGLLVNNGVIAAPLAINYLGLAKGAGVFGPVTVNTGGVFSPGNSPARVVTGDVTWNEGGRYAVEFADVAGDYDQWNIDGVLTIAAGPTVNSRFVIELDSLGATGFDELTAYRWPVLTTTGGIRGYDPADIVLDTSGFAGGGRGSFAVEQSDGGIYVTYTPIPEPTAVGVLAMAPLLLRRRRV